MNPACHPHWHLFRRMLDEGVPLALTIPGVPAARLYFEPPARLGLRVAMREAAKLPADLPDSLRVVRVIEAGEAALDVSTGLCELFPQVYFLLTLVAEEAQLTGTPAHLALQGGLAAFRRILAMEPVLSEAEQVGLLGDLWMLAQGVDQQGCSVVDTWVGPLGQPHDFRLGGADIEVKTTTGDHRIHPVSSLTQLQPSPGRPLHVLSLGFLSAPAAAGALTIRDAIEGLRAALGPCPVDISRFERLLTLTGWSEDTPDNQLVRFVNRPPPRLVLVDTSCPRIIPATLEAGLPASLAACLSDVRYSVNLDGISVPTHMSELAT